MQKLKLNLTPWHILFITILLFGVFFRCADLEKKVYWRDEALTSLQVVGYSQAGFVQKAFQGQTISAKDLQSYQQLNRERGLIDTIRALATETPEHPPLYYGLLRVWNQCFGSSIVITRSLSVLFGLLCLPCIYWLSLLLFKSPSAGTVTTSLFAVSPFHVAYAQEAREYSMWAFFTLLSSALLLSAIQKNTRSAWVSYCFSLIASLYCHPFTLLVAIAHTIYCFALSNWRFSRLFLAQLSSFIASTVVFFPWLLIYLFSLQQVNTSMGWMSEEKSSFITLVRLWFVNIANVFLLHPESNLYSFPALKSYMLFNLIVLTALAYCIYCVCRYRARQEWLFILCLMIAPFGILVVLDVLGGKQVSIIGRYLTPSFIGLELLVGATIATQLASLRQFHKQLATFSFAILISLGVISGIINLNSELGLSKSPNFALNLPQIVNQLNNSVLIGSSRTFSPTEILSLSHRLHPETRLRLMVEPAIPETSPSIQAEFLFTPFGLTPLWRAAWERQHQLIALPDTKNLWKVERTVANNNI